MTFSERLVELRKEHNLSQQGLANATGISQSSIARWELNICDPGATAIITLAKYFGETTDYILGLTD